LFDVIGTTYGAGDGSTTFNLPDLRGMFSRGWDCAGGTARGFDPGRVFGSTQGFAIQSHCHMVCATPGGAAVIEWQRPDTSTPIRLYPNGTTSSASTRTAGFTENTGGTETRPLNVAMLGIIKYELTYAPLTSSCGIPCACITGKGALITGTAAGTPVALPAGIKGSLLLPNTSCVLGVEWAAPGSNGQVLVACTACATGVTWQSGGNNRWITAGTVQSVGVSAILGSGAPGTAPTFTTTPINEVRYRQIGFKEWEVQTALFWTNGTSGQGWYAFTLPAGLQFDTTSAFQRPYTGFPNDALSWMFYGLPNSYARFSQNGASSYQQSTIIPYDATRYRIMIVGPNTDFWVDNYYSAGGAYNHSAKWSFTFTTP
jgi:microcystin-dependent protein